ncbi:MAG: hypothetical protein QM704_20495 [Anaeromyxobacteraceae bacterium]
MSARGLRAVALAAALAPAAAGADDPVVIGGGPADPGGTILGRVCVDLDGDGRCGPGEPGVAGARVFTAAGQVALADARGRYHLLEVPGRLLAGDRLAYGGQRLAVEGLPARALVDLAPGGAAGVDLPVRALAGGAPPLEPSPIPAEAPWRDGAGLHWTLTGRTAPGSRLAAGAAEATAGDDGAFALEVVLVPGDNDVRLTLSTPEGRAGVFRWPMHLVPREGLGDLVIPGRPALLAAFGVLPGAGGALVHGAAAPGARVRVGPVEAVAGDAGAFAAWVPGAAGPVEIALPGGAGTPAVTVDARGGTARLAGAGLVDVEVALGGDPNVLVSGRGTGAVRGALGPVSVEAGVDVDDRDRKAADLLKPRDGLTLGHALVPERSFLSAGDDAAADDRNAARGRAWARLRGPDLALDLGGTRAGLGGGAGGPGGAMGPSELGRYDRALFGARADVGRDLGPLRLAASAFGASSRTDARGNAPPAQARDAFAAHGGAFYWLSSGELVPGSASVRVEWRDPFTGLLTARRALVRGDDYELDEVSGRLALARPLPSVAAPAAVETGAPGLAAEATLVVEYLHAARGAGAEDLAGGRAGLRAGPVALEARGAREERPGAADYQLAGAAATLDLGFLGLRGEVARSRGLPGDAPFNRSWDGGYRTSSATPARAGTSADAVHLEGKLDAGPVRLGGWWRERDAGYADGGFEEAGAARERGASLEAGTGPVSGSVVWAERRGAPLAPGFEPANAEDARRIVGRGRYGGERLELVAEVVDAERRGAHAGEETGAGARVRYRLDPRVALDLSHHQGLRTTGEGVDPTFTAAGVALDLPAARFQLRAGWGPELGARLQASGERARGGEAVYGTFTADPDAPSLSTGGAGEVAALGARRRAGGTEVFTEERAGRDAFGLRTGRVVGLALVPAPSLRVSMSSERGQRLTPAGELVDRAAYAAAAGAVAGPVRVGLRGELRREGGDGVVAAGGSLEWRPVVPLVLSARAGYTGGTMAGVRARLLDLSGGAALRLGHGALVGTVTRLEEQRPGGLAREGVLGRLAATAELGRLQLGAGAGVAVQRVAGARDDRLSGSVRAAVRVVGPVDLGVEAARRGPLSGGDLGARSALRGEVGVRLGTPEAGGASGRLAVGYHVVGFDSDGLSPDEQVGRLFLRAQVAY